MNSVKPSAFFKLTSAIALLFGLATTSIAPSSVLADSVAQTPLLLGGDGVPGNLVLTPSVEYPTVISAANLDSFNINKNYPGYFDYNKCYAYKGNVSSNPDNTIANTRNTDNYYFYPTGYRASNGSCAGSWSGNYLNWAATQTIDPFRKALTGGYRHIDTASLTVLGKATRSDKGTAGFDNRTINYSTATQVTPLSIINNNSVTSSLASKRVMSLTYRNSSNRNTTQYYAVRVQACHKDYPETNCVRYGNNYKPEGLIQNYADKLRYSVFSYLNINGNDIDGGVMRSQRVDVRTEWNESTGVLKTNPTNASENNSGVINYINKFGEISDQLKSNDPVSELYYAAIRFLRGKNNLASYSSQGNSNTKKDHFPIITNWQDPITASCQKNAILGIGDANTHEDRDLLPNDDQFIDLVDFTKKIYDLEGINKSANKHTEFSGRGNSAYIAGLAYYANTQDIRPDVPGKQTVQTYWVDVRENGVLEHKNRNQYWLAAKYGGFEVPSNYQFSNSVPLANWHTNAETLSTGDKRPDNFFVGDDAENMARSLEQAFAKIAEDTQSSLTTVATNSSRLDTDTTIFQSTIDTGTWSGDLLARVINDDGSVVEEPAWKAAEKLDAISDVSNRNILTIKPGSSTSGDAIIAKDGIKFIWSELTSEQRTSLRAGSENDNTNAEKRLEYLRGDRSLEATGEFRRRASRLGDIANSDPQFVYKQNYGYSRLTWSSGTVANRYAAFRNSNDYQSRVPIVLVGANDGMLHAFNASTDENNGGEELFAFVPNNVFGRLNRLSSPEYDHIYYVDGTPRVADAYFSNKWATVAVGTTGAGGKSIFALDITNIKNKSSMTTSKVMWEFSHPKMGYTIGQPAIVALPNQKFGVIVTSGYHDNSVSDGYVWILDISDGSIIKEIHLSGSEGLGAPLVTDLDSDMQADRIYVGDLNGKLWRIDLASASTSSWGIPNSLSNKPLFIAKNSANVTQPITAPLSSAFNNQGEHMIVFGTGSYFRSNDNALADNPNIESIYGVLDRGIAMTSRTGFLQQKILTEGSVNGTRVRALTDEKLEPSHRGWYLDLAWDGAAKGERVVAKITVLGGRAIVTTMTPANDPCIRGGTSMIMALDLFNGGRLIIPYFDINKDGKIDKDDNTTINGESIPWSGYSDIEDGVIKGVATLHKFICYVGPNNMTLYCVPVSGSQREGRQSWREVTIDDE